MPERTLLDLAVARLRRLFPRCRIVRQMDARAAEHNAIVSSRCKVRACPWPSSRDGWCRQHFIDSLAERSVLPSVLASVIVPLHGPQFHPDSQSSVR